MFIFRYPGYSGDALRDLQRRAMQEAHNYFYNIVTTTEEEEPDNMEQSASQLKYTFDFPGIGPERVSVKLSADRKTITLYVDGTAQKSIIPPFIPGLKPEDLAVKMEHGRLTLIVNRAYKPATTEDEVSIPVNGKQFLQD